MARTPTRPSAPSTATKKTVAKKQSGKKTIAKKTVANKPSVKKTVAKNAVTTSSAKKATATTRTAATRTAATGTKVAKSARKSAVGRRPARPSTQSASQSSSPSTQSASQSSSPSTQSANPLVLGIDIGGSGIKGAPVDLAQGVLAVDRLRVDTPSPSTPQNCANVIATIIKHFEHATASNGPIGITYPGVVWDGVTLTAANVDKGWIDLDADAMLEEALKRPVTVINDAQAAVLAECRYGAAKNTNGLVLMLTFGTGIGSGLAYRGVAIPGVEFGHLVMHGRDAEHLAAGSVKDREKLSWKQWCERVNDYLYRIEKMLWPELIVIGGGLSDEPEKFLPRLKSRAPIVAASLVNGAGIVGAAIAATSQTNSKRA